MELDDKPPILALKCVLNNYVGLLPMCIIGQRRGISAAYYSLMVVCVELQKLGSHDRTASPTITKPPAAASPSARMMCHTSQATKVLPLDLRLLIGAG